MISPGCITVLLKIVAGEVEQWVLTFLGQGGFKEISFMISGRDVYKTLKFESDVHRVQRIPVTGMWTNSYLYFHCSCASEAEDVDVIVDNNDPEITVCRASGFGGQGVNTTDSAVQILYKPTGMIAMR